MAAAPIPDLKTLGRYNIERVLGKGAMGVVYEGVDPRLGRRVAIKTILKAHLDGCDRVFLRVTHGCCVAATAKR